MRELGTRYHALRLARVPECPLAYVAARARHTPAHPRSRRRLLSFTSVRTGKLLSKAIGGGVS